jgi:hypothetical protein
VPVPVIVPVHVRVHVLHLRMDVLVLVLGARIGCGVVGVRVLLVEVVMLVAVP